jgi:hypothetical protein
MRSAKVLKHTATLAAMSLLLCLSQRASAEDPVRFGDANLKAAIEATLGKTNPTPTDMLALTILNAAEREIDNLTGLSYATNLTSLNLWANQIDDISPLAGLTKLKSLWLQRNPLSAEAYAIHIPQILANNTGIDFKYDPRVDQSTLAVLSTTGGSVTKPGNGSFTYDWGAVVPVAATAQSGWHFAGWTGTAVLAGKVVDPASASTIVTVDDDYTLQANFESNQHTLTIICGEQGSVTTEVLFEGSSQTLTGAGSFVLDHGTQLKITAVPKGTLQFTGWTGTMASGQSTLVFTLTADQRIEAHFAMDPRTLIVSADEGGTVVNPGVGSFAFELGTTLPVEAVANPDYRFVRWTGTVADRKAIADPNLSRTSVVLNEGGTLHAHFEAIRGFLESWETAAGGSYELPKARFINADEGAWSLKDAVSESRECGPTTQRAEVLKLGSSQTLLLTSADSNSTCSDVVSVSLVEAGLVNPGFALPIDANTVLSFYEVGQLDSPGLHGSGQDCTVPPCFDNVSLLVSDNKGNVLAYVLQRSPEAVANTPNVNFRGSYGEIFLDRTGIYYQRNLLSDLRTIPAFDPVGAQVRSIEFRVDEHGSAILDEVAIGPGTANGAVPVYRFWSPVLESHFFTTGADEKQTMIDLFSSIWTLEGIAYFTPGDNSNPDAVPVYRFWSPAFSSHFYTISEAEKDMLLRDFPNVWTLDGIAFYAFPEGRQPVDACPVYRFWSGVLNSHFYTTSETERDNLVKNFPDIWAFEGVAWYAYPPQWNSGGALGIVRDRHKPEITK